jgi:hypothetical protein
VVWWGGENARGSLGLLIIISMNALNNLICQMACINCVAFSAFQIILDHVKRFGLKAFLTHREERNEKQWTREKSHRLFVPSLRFLFRPCRVCALFPCLSHFTESGLDLDRFSWSKIERISPQSAEFINCIILLRLCGSNWQSKLAKKKNSVRTTHTNKRNSHHHHHHAWKHPLFPECVPHDFPQNELRVLFMMHSLVRQLSESSWIVQNG